MSSPVHSLQWVQESQKYLPSPLGLKPLFKEVCIKLKLLKEGEIVSAGHPPVSMMVVVGAPSASGVVAPGSVVAEPQLLRSMMKISFVKHLKI